MLWPFNGGESRRKPNDNPPIDYLHNALPQANRDVHVNRKTENSSENLRKDFSSVQLAAVQKSDQSKDQDSKSRSRRRRACFASGGLLWSEFLQIWWGELLCCFLAAAALSATIITVGRFHGRPLPKWSYGLTLNALIAVYTVVLKMSAGLVLAQGIGHLKWTNLVSPKPLNNFVLHDDASRGPWGAALLLWNKQCGVVSSLGAAITLLLLLVDPFSQQIVRMKDCSEFVAGINATIPRVNSDNDRYDDKLAFLDRIVESGFPIMIQPVSRAIQNSVYNGIYADTKPKTEAFCPTGNCTFPERYTSLGYCSACRDVTDSLVIGKTSVMVTSKGIKENSTELKLFDEGLKGPKQPGLATLMNCSSLSHASNFVSDAGYDGHIQMIRRRKFETGEISCDPKDGALKAHHCQIYPCMKTIEAKVRLGVLEETVLEESGSVWDIFGLDSGEQRTEGRPEEPSFMMNSVYLPCASTDQKAQLRDIGYEFSSERTWLPYNVSVAEDKSGKQTYFAANSTCLSAPENVSEELCTTDGRGFPLLTDKAARIIPAECVYSIDLQFHNAVSYTLLGDIFSGVIESFGLRDTNPGRDAPLLALANAGSGNGTLEDIQNFMKGISDSMTVAMRNNRRRNHLNKDVVGVVFRNGSCVEVGWPWVAYSAVVIVLLAIFFLSMTIQARLDQKSLQRQPLNQNEKTPLMHDYKSSAATTLLHGFDQRTQDSMADLGHMLRESELEKKLKGVQVRMVATTTGWKLASSQSTSK